MSRDRESHRFADLPWLGALALAGLAFVLVPLAKGELFFLWDNAKMLFPQTVTLHEGLTAGRIPQWEHAVSSGYPLIGEGQAAHLHPIHLLLTWLFAPHVAFMLEIGLYTALTGLGMYAFLRASAATRLAATFGGLVAMFGGFGLTSAKSLHLYRSLWLLPFILLAAERFVRDDRKARYLILGGLAFGLQLLSGNPYYAGVGAVASGLWVLARAWQRAWCRQVPLRAATWEVARPTFAWVLAPLLGFGVAAIQTIPQLLHSEYSTRAGGMDFHFAMQVPASLRYLGQLLLPYAYEQGHLLDPAAWGGRDFNEVSFRGLYMGAAPFVLAVFALWRSGRWPDPTPPLAFLGVAGVALALGDQTPFYPALWSLPLFDAFRFPHRFLALLALALAALAGMGLTRLAEPSPEAESGGRPGRWRDAAVLGSMPLVAAAGAVLIRVESAPWLLVARDFDTGAVISVALVSAACALAFAASATTGRLRGTLCLTILALTVADLWYFRARSDYVPSLPIEEVMAPPPVAAFLRQDPDTFRIMSLEGWEEASIRVEDLREFVQANTSRIWDVDSADQYSSLMLGRYFLVHQRIVQELLREPRSAETLRGYLGALNVKYVIAPKPVELPGWEPVFETPRGTTWRNPGFLPRAHVVGSVVQERLEEREEWAWRARARLGRYPDMVRDWGSRAAESQIVDNVMASRIDYATTAVVSGADLPELGARESSVDTRIEGETMRFSVQVDAPGLLVVASTFYPGWEATVNGEPATIHRTNWVMSGVVVPAGSSDVVMRFTTPGLRVGAVISLSVLLASGLVLALTGWHRRRQPSS